MKEKQRLAAENFRRNVPTACFAAVADVLKELQTKANSVGANAIVAIASQFGQTVYASQSHCECASGTSSALVILKAKFVKMRTPMTLAKSCVAKDLPEWTAASAREEKELLERCRRPAEINGL